MLSLDVSVRLTLNQLGWKDKLIGYVVPLPVGHSPRVTVWFCFDDFREAGKDRESGPGFGGQGSCAPKNRRRAVAVAVRSSQYDRGTPAQMQEDAYYHLLAKPGSLHQEASSRPGQDGPAPSRHSRCEGDTKASTCGFHHRRRAPRHCSRRSLHDDREHGCRRLRHCNPPDRRGQARDCRVRGRHGCLGCGRGRDSEDRACAQDRHGVSYRWV